MGSTAPKKTTRANSDLPSTKGCTESEAFQHIKNCAADRVVDRAAVAKEKETSQCSPSNDIDAADTKYSYIRAGGGSGRVLLVRWV